VINTPGIELAQTTINAQIEQGKHA